MYSQEIKHSFVNVSETEKYIRKEYAEVFTPGWGNFKGQFISLKLKPEATPKSLPVRRVPYSLRDKVRMKYLDY